MDYSTNEKINSLLGSKKLRCNIITSSLASIGNDGMQNGLREIAAYGNAKGLQKGFERGFRKGMDAVNTFNRAHGIDAFSERRGFGKGTLLGMAITGGCGLITWAISHHKAEKRVENEIISIIEENTRNIEKRRAEETAKTEAIVKRGLENMKKFVVVERRYSDDAYHYIVEEFDTYAEAECYRDDCSAGMATGAEIMEINHWDEDEDYEYTDPNDVYFEIVEND